MPLDSIAHAYATIGLRPGARAQELKQQYKRLVKTWHPDRWANDPVNQAEAAEKMRAINAAYATLHSARTGEPPPQTSSPVEHWSTSHRALSDEELDAIVNAIGTESYVSGLLRTLAWVMPFAGALVAIVPQRSVNGVGQPMKPRDVTMAALLFVSGLVVLLAQKWTASVTRGSQR